MTDNIFMNLYWKQFLMIEKEFRKSLQYVALSDENGDSYSDFFAKILLQIGSEVDVVAKVLCKEINGRSCPDDICKYRNEILLRHPEIESISIKCEGFTVVPWMNWSSASPVWWKVYNGVKHNRAEVETYENVTKENYRFANLRNTVSALAGLYLLELYLYDQVVDADPHTDTPVPGSRLFRAIDNGWENKRTYADISFHIEDGCLMYVQPQYLYADL